MEEIEQPIYRITPTEIPAHWLKQRKASTRLIVGRGGSMRARRNRAAKPVRFTPHDKGQRIHGWVTDTLTKVMQ